MINYKILGTTALTAVLFTTTITTPKPAEAAWWNFMGGNNQQYRQEVQTANQQFKDSVEQAQTVRKTDVNQARMDMILALAKKHATNLQVFFDRRFAWLNNLETRITTNLGTRTGDKTDANAKLATAATAISTFKTAADAAVAAFNNVSGANITDLRASVKNAVSLAQTARADYRTAVQDLMTAWKAVKALSRTVSNGDNK
jgi:NADPH-dependent glutamate synthase beta subunit-like oxidoreductase